VQPAAPESLADIWLPVCDPESPLPALFVDPSPPLPWSLPDPPKLPLLLDEHANRVIDELANTTHTTDFMTDTSVFEIWVDGIWLESPAASTRPVPGSRRPRFDHEASDSEAGRSTVTALSVSGADYARSHDLQESS
jgi:hypothetical protein